MVRTEFDPTLTARWSRYLSAEVFVEVVGELTGVLVGSGDVARAPGPEQVFAKPLQLQAYVIWKTRGSLPRKHWQLLKHLGLSTFPTLSRHLWF